MKSEERIKLFKTVFAPIKGEKILFLVDIPHGTILDSQKWQNRRKMALEWYHDFRKMGATSGFTVDWLEYLATGIHNSPVPQKILDLVEKANLFLAMTEYSGTSSFISLCKTNSSSLRGASMPGIEKRMEETALSANYTKVKRYALALEKILNETIGAEALFSTGDTLYIDLRNRTANVDTGDCSKPGQWINFPSGETNKVPYEATPDEIAEFGESKTAGTMPVYYQDGIIKFVIKNNRIIDVIGDMYTADKMRDFFNQDMTHQNIAELGIGCNPNAVVTGNILEDEKVGGLHIAYGMSTHLSGKIKSDMHQDVCYPKGLPVEATTLTLINKNGEKTTLIQNAMLRYDLL